MADGRAKKYTIANKIVGIVTFTILSLLTIDLNKIKTLENVDFWLHIDISCIYNCNM